MSHWRIFGHFCGPLSSFCCSCSPQDSLSLSFNLNLRMGKDKKHVFNIKVCFYQSNFLLCTINCSHWILFTRGLSTRKCFFCDFYYSSKVSLILRREWDLNFLISCFTLERWMFSSYSLYLILNFNQSSLLLNPQLYSILNSIITIPFRNKSIVWK